MKKLGKSIVKYQQQVAWLEPFVKVSRGLVPLHKLRQVRGYRIPLGKREFTDGTCLTTNFKCFHINVKTHYQNMQHAGNNRLYADSHTPLPIYDVLNTLAHELAHLKEWDHTPAHWRLENRILRRFIRILEKNPKLDVSTAQILGIME